MLLIMAFVLFSTSVNMAAAAHVLTGHQLPEDLSKGMRCVAWAGLVAALMYTVGVGPAPLFSGLLVTAANGLVGKATVLILLWFPAGFLRFW